MKVMCNHCGKILDLMKSTSFVAEEDERLTTYHFCSDEHMVEFARKKGVMLGKS
jgi:YHS domain-containing protein